jgi:hypothetical protein
MSVFFCPGIATVGDLKIGSVPVDVSVTAPVPLATRVAPDADQLSVVVSKFHATAASNPDAVA